MAVKQLQKISKSEKIVNDFLIQLGYAVLASILLLFIYNGRMFLYGNELGMAMPTIIWCLFGVMLAAGIVFVVLWKAKGKNSFKVLSIYLFVTAAGLLWCAVMHQLTYYIHQAVPFLPHLNAKRSMEVLFVLIGLSVPAGLIAYFVRIRKLKKPSGSGKKKN